MTNENAKPLGSKILSWQFLVLLSIFCLSTFFIAKRFMLGLGAVTNMNDGYPFGIWIAIDVVVGTTFACGGYTMALLVYVANRGKYHPLVRPALMASVFGYTLAGVSVFIDIGRYWQMYNMFLPKFANPNSVMLEVGLCIATYTLVLWIEFSPVFLEKFGAKKAEATLNKVLFFFIALGVLLPTMHQSSLGTLMVIAGYKLSPLWQTELLPLLFLLSAISMGYGVVIFEGTIAASEFNGPKETRILSRVAYVLDISLAIFLVIRFGDLLQRGALPLAFDGSLVSNMFLLENGLMITAVVLLFSTRLRRTPHGQYFGALLLLAGSSLFRYNTYIIGFNPGTGHHYFPAVGEIMVTLGIISLELMAYLIFIKTLPVLPSRSKVTAG
jgi:Ni/Fe-hydrogenase subunit HybB-like protein